MSKVIAVFGATGQQGGSVVRALLRDKQYAVRAITRNPDGDSGKKLKQQGCEVVAGDMDNTPSLVAATKGAYGVFLVTNFFATHSKEGEIKQGRAAVDACAQNGVKHLVYSGLEHCHREIGIPVLHFDSKAEIEDYIEEKKIPFTFVRYAFYMENFISDLNAKKQDDGTYGFRIPMGDVPMDVVCTAKAGGAVSAIFNKPEEYIGKKIGLSGGKYTIEQIAEIFNKQFAPRKFKDLKMPLEQMRQYNEEFANMFEYYQRGKFSRDSELTRKLDPETPDLVQWVAENKELISKAY